MFFVLMELSKWSQKAWRDGFTTFRLSSVCIPRNCNTSFQESHFDFYCFFLEVLFLDTLLLLYFKLSKLLKPWFLHMKPIMSYISNLFNMGHPYEKVYYQLIMGNWPTLLYTQRKTMIFYLQAKGSWGPVV